jgi:hypothetical protein
MLQQNPRPKPETLRLQRKRRSLENEGVIAAQRVFKKAVERAIPSSAKPVQKP